MTKPSIDGASLGLPPPNPFLPRSTALVTDPAEGPVLLHSDASAIVWFNHDLKFRRPKGIVAVKIYTADLGFGHSDRARVFGEVWRECFNEYVREF